MEPVEETSNVNLGLKILFVILLLVLVGEIAYGVMNSRKKNSSQPVISNNKLNKLTPALINNKEDINRMLEFKGEIISFENETGAYFPLSHKTEWFLYLDIDTKDSKVKRLFSFDQNDLDSIKVTDSTGNVISYKELKIGQNILLNLNPVEVQLIDK